MQEKTRYFLKITFLGFGVAPLAASFLGALPLLTGMMGMSLAQIQWLYVLFYIFAAFLAVRWTAGKSYPDRMGDRYLPVCLPLLLTLAVCALCMVVSKGDVTHNAFVAFFLTEISFFPICFMMILFGYLEPILFLPLIFQSAFILFFLWRERRSENAPAIPKKLAAAFLSLLLLFGATIAGMRMYRRQSVLPPDYGFAYGGGYASVDIYRYDVSNRANLLPVLDQPSSFSISEQRNMPVLDGAEAAYPVYSAFANACYAGIAADPAYQYNGDGDATVKIPAKATSTAEGKITFTNTIFAFERLVNGEVDIFFGAQPSEAQKELARKAGKTLVLTPIGKDAFIFFVSEANPCIGLATEDIRDIYSGKVKNWKPYTGKNERIVPFQRPENSGSQTIMHMVMGEAPIAEPLKEEVVSGMGGIYENVANYRNYPGAIGYSFRFFTLGMADPADKIKLLSIDGAEPSVENIAGGLYPYTVPLYAITLEEGRLETVEPFLAWMQGPEGQELVGKIGYVPFF
ncbi:MAG: substrate-binding domain-containing protein [Clostridiales bacterium]|nr:substrate-binding domain-containing protein [Clostridiales bacterium]